MSETEFYTVGYEGLSIDRFIAAIAESGVTTLIDVRDRAQSRKKGFSKTALTESLKAIGVNYVHLKALGDPKEGREAARAGRISEFKRIFSKVMESIAAIKAVDVLLEISEESQTCLLCYERDAEFCHRSLILSVVAQRQSILQTDLLINENNIGYETKRRVPYFNQSIAA